MSLPAKLHKLEGFPFRLPPIDDAAVLAAIRSGLVFDDHLDWLDALFRPTVQLNLATFALAARLRCEFTTEFLALENATAVGTHVLACPSETPLPPSLESRLRHGLYFVDIRTRALSERTLGTHARPQEMGGTWLFHRLVGNALGPDLGQALRAGLDRIIDEDVPVAQVLDLRRPHPVVCARMRSFVEAFNLDEARTLMFDDRHWDRLDLLSGAGPPSEWT